MFNFFRLNFLPRKSVESSYPCWKNNQPWRQHKIGQATSQFHFLTIYKMMRIIVIIIWDDLSLFCVRVCVCEFEEGLTSGESAVFSQTSPEGRSRPVVWYPAWRCFGGVKLGTAELKCVKFHSARFLYNTRRIMISSWLRGMKRMGVWVFMNMCLLKISKSWLSLVSTSQEGCSR